METAKVKDVAELIEKIWQSDVLLSKKDAKKYINAEEMKKEHIVITDNEDDTIKFSINNTPVTEIKEVHNYIMPSFVDEVRALLKNAIDCKHSCNIMLTGPMGTGKTEFVHEIAKEMGFAKVFQVNGSEGLTNYDFFGSLAVDVDPVTKQNYTHFDKGALYRAFIEGTELDANGNQVLDANGNPKIIGKPAVFFLDEFASMLPEVFLGVFNRAMEIPRNEGGSRSIEITADGGRIVKSHPGMVMFFSGNTVGTGNNGKYQMAYSAQGNRMDESTLNRISGSFRFGYNKKAEEEIATHLLNDDLAVAKVLKLRDEMRVMFRNEKVERLFSTRTLVQICNTAKIYREGGIEKWITKAIKTSVFSQLPDDDKNAWNEVVRAIWGVDFLAEENREKRDYDYI